VVKYRRYPISKDELAIYFYNRFIYSGKERTLPFMTEKWTEDFIEEYKFVGLNNPKKKRDIEDICALFKIQNNAVRANLE
jgi:hypothetical protein